MDYFSSAMLSCFDICYTGATFCEVLALELLKCFTARQDAKEEQHQK
jgi:hypothetical protein